MTMVNGGESERRNGGDSRGIPNKKRGVPMDFVT